MDTSKIFINGFPKAGIHLLRKALELMGVFIDVDHRAYSQGFSVGKTKCILIKRDPRNIVISMLKFRGLPVSANSFETMTNNFLYADNTASLAMQLEPYKGWLTDPNTFVTSYEALQSSEAEMIRLANYLGVPYKNNFNRLEGVTLTYSKVHADHGKIWTPALNKKWNDAGGVKLLSDWGY